MPFILSVELKDLGTCQLRKNSLDCHLSKPDGCGKNMRIGCLRMEGALHWGLGEWRLWLVCALGLVESGMCVVTILILVQYLSCNSVSEWVPSVMCLNSVLIKSMIRLV